jgi:hypothetical protein
MTCQVGGTAQHHSHWVAGRYIEVRIVRAKNALLAGAALVLLIGACSGNSSQTVSSPVASQIESPLIDKNAAAFANLEADSAPFTATFKTDNCVTEGFELIRCDLQVIRLTPTEGRVRNEAVVSTDANPLNIWTGVVQCTYTLDGDSYAYFAGTFDVTFEGPWGDDIPDRSTALNNGLTSNGDRLCPGSIAP